MRKYVFVTGGVVSSIGKGITSSSLGRLLKNRGFKVNLQKIDPYLNWDAGTMNPFQHGEVFVTDDGAETDLDLGNYERFVDLNLDKDANVTTGKVYGSVIARERKGDYLGQTVQVIPHITDEIKNRIVEAADKSSAEVQITEIGGTVGDIESQPYLEAIRQFRRDVGHENVLFIHVTLIPFVGPRNEMKTKPTQHSVRELRGIGIQPDLLICRTKMPLDKEMRRKIALFCDLEDEAIIEALDTEELYEIPLIFEQQGMAELVCRRLHMDAREPDLAIWKDYVRRAKEPKHELSVAIVGKYIHLRDSYMSIIEAFKHAAAANEAQVNLKWIDAEKLEGPEALSCEDVLCDVDALLVPGGFGNRGIEGKISAISYARKTGLPFLGLCLGMQCAVIEFARETCGLTDAHSTEFDPDTTNPVIDLLESQIDITDLGGTMRLGSWRCKIVEGSLAHRLYGEVDITERHRHRYELNNTYRELLTEKGLSLSGTTPDGALVELIELPDHPYFIATQGHPEFKSRPNRPHPLFVGLLKAALDRK